jgi:hypothetical protein
VWKIKVVAKGFVDVRLGNKMQNSVNVMKLHYKTNKVKVSDVVINKYKIGIILYFINVFNVGTVIEDIKANNFDCRIFDFSNIYFLRQNFIK